MKLPLPLRRRGLAEEAAELFHGIAGGDGAPNGDIHHGRCGDLDHRRQAGDLLITDSLRQRGGRNGLSDGCYQQRAENGRCGAGSKAGCSIWFHRYLPQL